MKASMATQMSYLLQRRVANALSEGGSQRKIPTSSFSSSLLLLLLRSASNDQRKEVPQ
jgi:hypothetical protein